MDFFQPLLGGIAQLGDPVIWIAVMAGTILGVIVGALPGVGITLAYGLVLPFTFVMDPVYAVAFLLSISVGSQYGNSIPAILMAIPGSPSAVLSVADGHALHKRGESALALAVAFVAALGGQAISILLFILLIVPLMGLAYKIAQPEQFALYVLGIIAIISLTGRNVVKGLAAAGFGFLIALIGLDPVNLTTRLDFGFRIVRSGIDLTPVVVGLLAVSELFRSTRQVFRWQAHMDKPASGKFPDLRRLKPTLVPILGGTVIGTLVGAVPGAGSTPAAMISYQQAQLFSKHPEEFGNGSIEGLAANEAAQNASNSGELIPTFGLGIPGSGSMVLLLTALTVQGFIPGPLMIRNAPELFYAAISGMLAATIFLVATGWWMAKAMLKTVNLNRSVIIILSLVTVVLGIYSLNIRIFDVFVCLVCGAVGYLMIRYGYSVAAAALAAVLGGELERNLRLGLNLTNGSWTEFLARPLTAAILVFTLALLFYGIYRQVRFRTRMSMIEAQQPDGKGPRSERPRSV